jgi:hypothetical protein
VGAAVGPRLPFWLDVVTESEDVAVVVPWAGLSILTVTVAVSTTVPSVVLNPYLLVLSLSPSSVHSNLL